jgi:hypothetical protein
MILLLVYYSGSAEEPEINKYQNAQWRESMRAGLFAKLRAALLVLHST